MSNPITDAIAAAKEAAAQAPLLANTALGGGVPATQNSAPLPATRGAPLDIDDMLGGSLTVDAWLKVNEFGMLVGTDKTLHESFEVILNMNEIAYCYSVRFGNPAQYEKTYDRVTNVKGGSWVETLQRAQRIDDKASEFRSADVPFYLVNDVKSKDGKTVVLAAGKSVGHSISITGWKGFQAFIRQLMSDGVDVRNAKVALTLGYNVETNAKGTWGTLKFSDPKVVQ